MPSTSYSLRDMAAPVLVGVEQVLLAVSQGLYSTDSESIILFVILVFASITYLKFNSLAYVRVHTHLGCEPRAGFFLKHFGVNYRESRSDA